VVQALLKVEAMRWANAIVLVLTGACGTDVREQLEDAGSELPDGGVPPRDGSTSSTDDGGTTGDAPPSNLTPCEEAAFHADLAWIQKNVFDVSCTTNCHSGPNPGAGMNLTAPFAHAHLVNVASTQFGGWIRVVPNAPGASMLMVQLGGEPGPELEGFMPWGMPRLCDPMIDAIRRWIAAGAPP
jgi:hypothetical protein